MMTLTPTFQVQIEGQELSRELTQEITRLVFEDNETSLDVLELQVANRGNQFTDHPLLQEGNDMTVRFGYLGNLSSWVKATIKEMDYNYPESGSPTLRVKAFDKGHRLATKEVQKVWKKPPPGILYSEIAQAIATNNGLIPKVTATLGYHLRVVQSNISDARFLQELASKSRAKGGNGSTGFAFYVEGDTLHFHPQALAEAPSHTLTYFVDRKGALLSFRPKTQTQGAAGKGVETRTMGIDPRKREAVDHRAGNATTPQRPTLGTQTYLIDGNSGAGGFKKEETGHIVPSFERTESFHEEPADEPAVDVAEGTFRPAELRQVEAVASTLGDPSLKAKTNIAIHGVGKKFSGIYYCISVRHTIGTGYRCELKLRKNAFGQGVGAKAEGSKGQINDQPANPLPEPPPMVVFDANTGRVQGP